jgi:hypothetical protein
VFQNKYFFFSREFFCRPEVFLFLTQPMSTALISFKSCKGRIHVIDVGGYNVLGIENAIATVAAVADSSHGN